MWMNPRGDGLSGVAGVSAAINSTPIALDGVRPMGDWAWLTDVDPIGQVERAWFNPATGSTINSYELWTQSGGKIADRGAYRLMASGTGAWATEWGSSWGAEWTNRRPCAGGSGFIAVIDDYAAGLGLTVYRDDGSVALDVLPNPQPLVEPVRSCRIHDGLLAFWDTAVSKFRLIDLVAGVELDYLERQDGVLWFVAYRGLSGVELLEVDFEGILLAGSGRRGGEQ